MSDYKDFKPLRNRLRKFSRRSVIYAAATQLHEQARLNGREEIEAARRFPPHLLLKIIEWSFDRMITDEGGEAIDEREFASLMNKVHEFESKADRPKIETEEDLIIVVRRLSVQQFWQQFELHGSDIGRTRELFLNSPEAHVLRRLLQQHVGIGLQHFMEMSFILAFLSDDTCKQPKVFSEFARIYGPDNAAAFERLVTASSGELQSYLKQSQAIDRVDWGLYEASRLRRFPIWRIGEEFWSFSPQVLKYLMRHFLYDVLKADLGNTFTDPFTDAVEWYVTKLIGEFPGSLLTESDLQRLPPFQKQGHKVTDLVLCEADGNCVVESKAIELSPLASVAPGHGPIHNQLARKIAKAIIQIYQTVNGLNATPAERLPEGVDVAKPFRGIIVSYKPLYLGRTWEFVRDQTKDLVDAELGSLRIDPAILPLENYFADVEELEMMAGSLPNVHTLSSFLTIARDRDAREETRRLLIKQHVEELVDDPAVPDFLVAAHQDFKDECMKRVRAAAGP